MNMDQQTAGLLLIVATELSRAAKHCQAASYWLRSEYAPGLSAMACVEAKERREYAGKIYEHICDHGGIIPVLQATESVPATGQGWTAGAVLDMISKKDNAVLVAIKGAVGKLTGGGEHGCAKFLMDLEADFWKDINEIRQAMDHAGEKVPPGLLILDKEYGKRYGGE